MQVQQLASSSQLEQLDRVPAQAFCPAEILLMPHTVLWSGQRTFCWPRHPLQFPLNGPATIAFMGWMSFQIWTWTDENNKCSVQLIKCEAYFLTHLQILAWVSFGEQSQVRDSFQVSKWNSLMRRPRRCRWHVNWKKSTLFNGSDILFSFHMCLRHVELNRNCT